MNNNVSLYEQQCVNCGRKISAAIDHMEFPCSVCGLNPYERLGNSARFEEFHKDSVDPKQSQAVKKMSFDAVPISLLLHAQPGNQNGADKYGLYNWLQLDEGSMSMSTYLNALQRHLILFRAGQDLTSDTGIHNLDSMISGLAVLRDAMLFNKIKDDRVKLSNEQIEILEKLINRE